MADTYANYSTIPTPSQSAAVANLASGNIGTVTSGTIGGQDIAQMPTTPLIAPPAAPVAAVDPTAGNLTGLLWYVVTFVASNGAETSIGAVAVASPSSQRVALSVIPISPSARVVARKIYRTNMAARDAPLYQLVATLADNTTTIYSDNIANGALGAGPPIVNGTGAIQYSGTVLCGAASDAVTTYGQNAGLGSTNPIGTYIGDLAGHNDIGYSSCFVGEGAGDSNVGIYCEGFGIAAGQANLGQHVTSLGSNSGHWNSGAYCLFAGHSAGSGRSNADRHLGNCNTIMGHDTCPDKTGGGYNVFVGSGGVTGEGTFLHGTQKGIDSSVILGACLNAGVNNSGATQLTNIIAINGIATGSNQTVIGNANTLTTSIFGRIVSLVVGTANGVGAALATTPIYAGTSALSSIGSRISNSACTLDCTASLDGTAYVGTDNNTTLSLMTNEYPRVTILSGGNNLFKVGVGVTAPSAVLHLRASTTTAGTGSLKFAPGVLLTTPEAGVIEYDGTHLYFTDSSAARHTLSVVA